MLTNANDPFFPDGLPDLANSQGPPKLPAPVRRKPPVAAFPDPISLLKAVRHRWLLALSLAGLAGTLAGGLAWKLLPVPKYTATAELEVRAFKQFLMADVTQDRTDFKIFQGHQLALGRQRVGPQQRLGPSRHRGIAHHSRTENRP